MPLWMWQVPVVVLSLVTWLSGPSTTLADMAQAIEHAGPRVGSKEERITSLVRDAYRRGRLVLD